VTGSDYLAGLCMCHALAHLYVSGLDCMLVIGVLRPALTAWQSIADMTSLF